MRILHLFPLAGLLLLGSCTQFEVTAQGGYAQLAIDGDLGYVQGGGGVTFRQDLEPAFGLGDDQGTPYARLAFDMGTPTLYVSAFLFEDEGQGTLTADFGGNLTAGTSVLTDFDLMSARAALAFDIPIGPVSISPGVAVDFVDLQVFVRDTIGIASEDVQLQAPLPLGYLRAEADFGVVALVAEGGYIKVDVEDVNVELLDLEALVELNVLAPLNLFAGYRAIDLKSDGLIDSDSFDIDLGISGFVVGGGVRF